ncbi:MAG TPA: UDP-glucose 4-epimerase GalE [Herpetosiphonaceae bacterium]|nr:UDP-glucose 4-epimerase GalE [Herpetosiphonaceae bacterium]
MKVLVTGGAGYIGSIAAEELIKAGHTVVVFDNLSRGHRGAVPTEAAFFHGDLLRPETIDRCFHENPGIEGVMHFAALALVPESMRDPGMYFQNNVTGTQNLVEAMLRHGALRLIFSSTCATYGLPEIVPMTEETPTAPINAYGESKLMVERMLRWYSDIHGLSYAALRYFNACGATETRGEDHQPETHMIPIVLEVALGEREFVPITGDDYPTRDGTGVRDYIHVVDLASAHILALLALQPGERRIYNLGTGTGVTVREIIEAARDVTGHPIPERSAPRRPGDPPELVAAAEKAKRELGWQPRHSDIHTIMRTAWNWHQSHPAGYSDH